MNEMFLSEVSCLDISRPEDGVLELVQRVTIYFEHSSSELERLSDIVYRLL